MGEEAASSDAGAKAVDPAFLNDKDRIAYEKLCMLSTPNAQNPMEHGPVETVLEGAIWSVQGRFAMSVPPLPKSLTYLSRRMSIIKQSEGLVLVNAIWLSEEGWKAVDKLGKVVASVRLSSFHGSDDALVAGRYKCPLWLHKDAPLLQGWEEKFGEPKYLSSDNLPFDNAQMFLMPKAVKPEILFFIPDVGNGVLISCDLLQNNPTTLVQKDASYIMGLVMKLVGFGGPGRAGPPLLEATYTQRGMDAKEELVPFLRSLMALPFETFLTGHGDPIACTAKPLMLATLKKQFGTDFNSQ